MKISLSNALWYIIDSNNNTRMLRGIPMATYERLQREHGI